MKRGTTPIHTFKTSIDLSGATVFVSYAQSGRVVVEKTGTDLDVTSESVTVRLSQKDTLKFNASCHLVHMQIRCVFSDGTADASDIMTADIADVLKDGEISYV